MNRKTKDLILIYICFALFAVVLIIWGITLKSCKYQMAQSQEVVQEQQAFRQIWEACGSQCIGTYYVNR